MSHAIVVSTAYGPMILNRHDINQTNALVKTGFAVDHDELEFLSLQIMPEFHDDAVVIDAGACFGTYTLALAYQAALVIAIEPQRDIYHMLCGSVALGGWQNIHCINAALGREEGTIAVPGFDYNLPCNFGSIEFGPVQKEKLDQERGPSRESVPLITLDSLDLDRIDLIKIDVEGMEADVLLGGMETLRRFKPVVYIECIKSDHQLLYSLLVQTLDYQIENRGPNWLCK